MEGAVLAGKLAAEIVVDDALGEVRPLVYICGLYIPYSTSIPSTCELVYPTLDLAWRGCNSNPAPAPAPDPDTLAAPPYCRSALVSSLYNRT